MTSRARPQAAAIIKVLVLHGRKGCEAQEKKNRERVKQGLAPKPPFGQDHQGCGCTKSLYIREGGTTTEVFARTRAWERAESLAQAERDKRDPVKQRLREIEEEEAQRAKLRKPKNITVQAAAGRWIKAQKFRSGETERIYNRAAWRIVAWAEDRKVVNLREVDPDTLDA